VLVSPHEKAKVYLPFPFPSFFIRFVVPFGTSERAGKQGKGAGKEEFREHWIFLLLLDPPPPGRNPKKGNATNQTAS